MIDVYTDLIFFSGMENTKNYSVKSFEALTG